MMLNLLNTTRCNFRCAHCLFSCTPKGVDITKELFCHTVDKFFDKWDYINFLGGEPFLHKDIFWQIDYLLNTQPEYLRIVTNGSWILSKQGNPTKKFWEFSKRFGRRKEITIALSDDHYHSEFSVWSAKDMENTLRNYCEGIEVSRSYRKYGYEVLPLGRAVENCLPVGSNTHAICSSYSIDEKGNKVFDEVDEFTLWPNGDVSACCNGGMILGTVFDDVEVLRDRFSSLLGDKTVKDCFACSKMVHPDYTAPYGSTKSKKTRNANSDKKSLRRELVV